MRNTVTSQKENFKFTTGDYENTEEKCIRSAIKVARALIEELKNSENVNMNCEQY